MTTWIEIKNILIINFSSFKNSHTLHEELRSTSFKHNVLEFYNDIQHKLSILNQKCKQEGNLGDIPLNIQTALNIFKNNISEPMKSILYARNPTTMERALHILSEGGYLYNRERPNNNQTSYHYDNKNFINNNNFKNNFQQRTFVPRQNNFLPRPQYNNYQQKPQNNFVPRQQYNNNQRQNFNNNRPQYNNQQQNYNDRQRLFNNHNIQPRPEPMEVDTSAQMRRNYYNEQEAPNENFPLPASETPYHM